MMKLSYKQLARLIAYSYLTIEDVEEKYGKNTPAPLCEILHQTDKRVLKHYEELETDAIYQWVKKLVQFQPMEFFEYYAQNCTKLHICEGYYDCEVDADYILSMLPRSKKAKVAGILERNGADAEC